MNKVILFGGSFNPPHVGHLNVMESALEKFSDHKIVVVPSYKSPLKFFNYDPGIKHRIEMIKVATENLNVVVDSYEAEQNKKCYTVDVIPYVKKKYQAEKIVILVGLDQLYQFEKWKNYKDILQSADLLITSRPGFDFPELDDLSQEIKEMVVDYTEEQFVLSTGSKIMFMPLEKNNDISSSDIRTNLRRGQSMDDMMPAPVVDYIQREKIFEKVDFKIEDYEKFTIQCRDILKDKNGLGVLAYDVRNITQPSEFNLIASGTNTRHTSALAENLIKTIRKSRGLSPIAVEGLSEGRWVVIDYGSLIIHVFYDYVRNEYRLEELWSEGNLLGE